MSRLSGIGVAFLTATSAYAVTPDEDHVSVFGEAVRVPLLRAGV